MFKKKELLLRKALKKLYFSLVIKLINVSSSIFTKISERKDVAFIRMDILGDNFIFLPFLLKYKSLYPDALWIVNSSVAPLYSLLNLNYIKVNQRKFRSVPTYRFKVLRKILSMSFELAVNLVPHRAQIEGDEILKLLRAERKICYGNDFIKWLQFNNRICNELITYDYNMEEKSKPYVHIFEHEKNFFEKLTGKDINENVKQLYRAAFEEIKNTIVCKPSFSKYVVVLPDASSQFRKFPLKNWQKLLNSLPKNLKLVQLGLNKFPLKHPNFIDLTGKTSIEEAMSIVMNASLVIGNETGLTHLAYLSGVPTVCILGGGHFGRFLPWPEFDDVVKCVYKPMDCFQCGWKCKYVNLQKGEVPPCISQISPESVLEAIEELNEKYRIIL